MSPSYRTVAEGGNQPPNVLFVVWDACRYDYAVEHASFLNELASSNMSFERAIAPSPWSLPSHASFFTGKHPHEHGSNRLSDSVDATLARKLSDQGYNTYGVSANGFASQRTGFDEGFDVFRYTGGRDLYIDGMDVSGDSQEILRQEGTSQKDALLEVLRRIPRHDHSLKSLANFFSVACGELATTFDTLQQISHPMFAPTSDYSYRPEKNTRTIRSILKNHDNNEPFFLFTNYMDTHRCYKPSDDLQKKHIGRSLEYSELIRLNEEIAAPWEFENKKVRDELVDEDLEDIRGLYAGEVETADMHLRKIYQILEFENMLDDTIIVVTADHGENLGETDEMGRQRMGHVASVSDAVLHVPLVVANPKLDGATVSEPVSLKDVYHLLLNPGIVLNADIKSKLVTEAPTASQYPATGGGDETIENHPGVPEDIVHHQSSENSAVAYNNSWKVVAESTGMKWTRKADGSEDEAPTSLVQLAERHLEMLSEAPDNRMTEKQASQLEALGYL